MRMTAMNDASFNKDDYIYKGIITIIDGDINDDYCCLP